MKFAEIVSPGHPDKLADVVSDSVLDLIMTEEGQEGRGAIETLISSGERTNVILAGEISSPASLSDEFLQKYIENILGRRINFTNLLTSQSHEIKARVTRDKIYMGDQGVVVGYACNDTFLYMPLEHEIARYLANLLYNTSNIVTYDFLERDGKILVVLNDDCKHDFVISWCHAEGAEAKTIELIRTLLRNVAHIYDIKIGNVIINPPDGSWTYGGPQADSGLTGRKIIADSYGPHVPHGGGAYSGKDLSKTDRALAYWARFLAKKAVAENITNECVVQITSAMGLDKPLHYHISDPDAKSYLESEEYLDYPFDDIVKFLYRGYNIEWLFRHLAKYGHVGFNPKVNVPWENVK